MHPIFVTGVPLIPHVGAYRQGQISFVYGSYDGLMSAVESKPASDGRIKTSHFFRLNRSEVVWQGIIEHFETWGENHVRV